MLERPDDRLGRRTRTWSVPISEAAREHLVRASRILEDESELYTLPDSLSGPEVAADLQRIRRKLGGRFDASPREINLALAALTVAAERDPDMREGALALADRLWGKGGDLEIKFESGKWVARRHDIEL